MSEPIPNSDSEAASAEDGCEALKDLSQEDLHDLVLVARAQSTGDAMVIVAKLEEAGIPAVMEGQAFAIPGLSDTGGAPRVRVPRKLLERARENLPERWESRSEQPEMWGSLLRTILQFRARPVIALNFIYFGIWALLVGISLMAYWEWGHPRWEYRAVVVSMLMLAGGSSTTLGAFLLAKRFRLVWALFSLVITAFFAALPFMLWNPGT